MHTNQPKRSSSSGLDESVTGPRSVTPQTEAIDDEWAQEKKTDRKGPTTQSYALEEADSWDMPEQTGGATSVAAFHGQESAALRSTAGVDSGVPKAPSQPPSPPRPLTRPGTPTPPATTSPWTSSEPPRNVSPAVPSARGGVVAAPVVTISHAAGAPPARRLISREPTLPWIPSRMPIPAVLKKKSETPSASAPEREGPNSEDGSQSARSGSLVGGAPTDGSAAGTAPSSGTTTPGLATSSGTATSPGLAAAPRIATTPSDIAASSDIVAPSDIAAPSDIVAPSDIAAPSDNVAPSDIVASSDVAASSDIASTPEKGTPAPSEKATPAPSEKATPAPSEKATPASVETASVTAVPASAASIAAPEAASLAPVAAEPVAPQPTVSILAAGSEIEEEHDPSAEALPPPSRLRNLAIMVASAAVVVAAGWLGMRVSRLRAVHVAASTPAATQPPTPARPMALPSALPPTESPSANSAAAVEGLAPGSATGASSVSRESASAEATDTVPVELKIRPYGSLIFQKGKQIGRCPLTLDLPRGEKRTYEVVAPGYVTRRIVVDGSKPTISFAMKPVTQEPEEE